MPFQLTPEDLQRWHRDGYLVVRGLAAPEMLACLDQAVQSALEPLRGPAEFEADLGYPGAPGDLLAEGGDTPRRLLHAYSRDACLRAWSTGRAVADHLRQLVGSPRVALSQAHHNCIMTKHPGFSSMTSWHQDVRYWSFDRPELVSAWLAMGREAEENGALQVIPGSHLLDLDRGHLDRDLFLRTDLEPNHALLERAVSVDLDAGDVLFFHCRLFHAAGRNRTGRLKSSIVFTYHAHDNQPIPGTRSARYPTLPVD